MIRSKSTTHAPATVLIASLLWAAGPSCTADSEAASHQQMDPLDSYLQARRSETPPPDRLELLEPLARSIAEREGTQAVFICTHNSRRSHLAQIWAQVAAWQSGLDDVRTFSGGTEATAFNPRAVAALERAGLQIETDEPEADNPLYRVVVDDTHPALECYSKRFSDPGNPMSDFTAVMTCSDADEACPVVSGAARRFAVTYVDPKLSDGTAEEIVTYDDRCAQIAREMCWVMKRAAQLRDG